MRPVLALALSIIVSSTLPTADDAEWRARTGVDPGRGPAAAPGKVEPTAVPDLVLWLDASQGVTADAGGKVAAWADRSPRKQDLAQADPAWQPLRLEGALGGLPAVRFTGEQNAAQTLLRDKLTLAGSPGFTAIALVKQNREVYSSTLLHYGPDNMQRGAHLGLNMLAAAVGPTRDFAMTVTSAASLPGTGFRCLAVVADNAAGAQELWVDGARVAHTVQTFALEPEGRFVLGGHRPGAGNCHGGACADVAELLVFSRALSTEERQGLQKYLNTKWGLAGRRGAVTALAARLPFAYYPSTAEIELAFDKSADLLQEHLGGVFRPAADTTALKPEPLKPGLTWATYDGKKLPDDPAKATPTATGTAGDLDLPGGSFDPKEGTPYVLAGWLDVPQAAPYTFVLRPQTASRLWIDGKLIADVSDSKGSWGTWNWRGDAVALAAGRHCIVLAGLAQHRPVEHTGQPMVLWSGPGFWRRPIPAEKLAHAEPEALALPAAEKPDSQPQPKALAKITEALFTVIDVKKEKKVASGTLKLDASGRGQGRFPVGDLAEGEYAVEYEFAGKKVRLPQTFTRARFPWGKNTLGTGHEVYPPFVPVKVDGAQVSVVAGAYHIGAFGTFDSLVSQGRELLAAPMAVIAKVGGTEVAWKPGKVKGKATQPDLAEFSASASSDALTIEATTQVEEDGCARIEWTYGPKGKPVTVDWLELVIPLKEAEAPLFGWSASDSMRHHYWGEVPPAGNITWDTEQGKAPGWVPAAWQKAEGPAPADGRVWDSTRNLHWTHGNFDPFVAYVWLGAEERGLAWFADRPGQFVGDAGQPDQLVCREPGRVVLRVRVIQQPTLLDGPRRLLFGLQASPTKPPRPDWRTHDVPGGGGLSVVCWGGYWCSSKYPDNHDYSVVDAIMRLASDRRDVVDREVREKLKELDAGRLWKDMKVFGDCDWLTAQTWWLGMARNRSAASYVEEHANHVRMPEWQVFQDEWSALEFNRFQAQEGNWGVIAPSYRDFCLYYHNEYLRRGVSLYFDNVMPRTERNPYVLDGVPDYSAGVWGLRSYYKRVWKQMQRLERDKAAPLPLDFTVHITNCQVLPWTTWATSTLDLEQPYRAGKPFPPGYTRAMTSGRHAGVVAHGMYPLANYNDYRDKKTSAWTEEEALADWGMYQVHEVRSSFFADWRQEWKQWRSFRDALRSAGYGHPQARIINYWQPADPVSVRGAKDVAWLAIVLPPDAKVPAGVLGIVLLQSYADGGAQAAVTWKGAKAFVDHRTRQAVGAGGENVAVDLPGKCGTRLLWALERHDAAP